MTLPWSLLHTDGGRVNRSAPYGPADSYREFRHPLAALVLAVVTAGALDAFAFLRYGAFVANQSGNAIFLGMGPAGGHPTWPVSAASIVAFATAAGLVNLLRRRTRPTVAPLVDIAVTEAAMIVWAVLNLVLAYGERGDQPAGRPARGEPVEKHETDCNRPEAPVPGTAGTGASRPGWLS
ncbi:DUF1275 family protein [Micromonospora aurantiaca (nom. illeg.)]|uniref:DUF1275 family protein n=1 Tax=Micromonospora aurantiaca (nom. illeg.) TaxID=47850 RepID=UPI00382F8D0A